MVEERSEREEEEGRPRTAYKRATERGGKSKMKQEKLCLLERRGERDKSSFNWLSK
jgi:hypothetical protein